MDDRPTNDDHAGDRIEIAAADGLSAMGGSGGVRIAYGGHEDWFGPGRLLLPDSRDGGAAGDGSAAADDGAGGDGAAGAAGAAGGDGAAGRDRSRSVDLGGPDVRTVEGVDDLGSWHAALWLGARGASPRIDASLAGYHDRPLLVFSLRAPLGVEAGLATGTFDDPAISWPAFAPAERVAGGLPDDAAAFGYQYMEFALPTASGVDLAGWTRWPLRPAVIMPLLIVADGAALLLGPLDSFHEQVIAVPSDVQHSAVGVRCGWHGDLDAVPAGFTTELGVVAGADARECLETWGEILVERAATPRLPRGVDAIGSHVSYWTDNGAAYWYRTEGDRDVTTTLIDTLADLRARAVPHRAVQLDSWWYPHRSVRPFDTDEWDVPPTGLDRWEAREDILPGGIAALRAALGDPPLVAHCRHLSSSSPYLQRHECWVDGEYAHPVDVGLYETYLDQAAVWGVETFEHDWLVECFLGVRGLRERAGRATEWQRGLDAALAERAMTAQWCMATPADMMAATSLAQVTSIRTSGDHGYLVSPQLLWAWFLYTNALVRPLGLWPYKDVFRTDGHGGSGGDHTDPQAEAALAALSGGPVGIGDPLGATDRDLVLATCRADGTLVAPDAPIAAIGRCFARHGVLTPEPVVGATHSAHGAGRWSYVITMNCHDGTDTTAAPVRTRVRPAELGADAPAGATGGVVPDVLALDWRSGRVERVRDTGIDVTLAGTDWALHVLSPVLAGGRLAFWGDVDRFATVGRQRISSIEDLGDRVRCRIVGAQETVRLVGWSARGVPTATLRSGGAAGPISAVPITDAPITAAPITAGHPSAADDVLGGVRFELRVDLPDEPGWVELVIEP